jgi:hypothetical protein
MATLAGDASPDVRPVVEVDVVRQGMDALPGNGLAGLEGRDYALDFGLVDPSDGVAVHAGFYRRNPGVTRALGTGVAIEARNVVVARVQSVGKGDRLPRRIATRESVRLGGVSNRQQGRQDRNRANRQDYAPEAVSWMHAVLTSESMPDSGERDRALTQCHSR